ncbi:MAG: class I SAM-dependent methyltransferase, partial [Calditrichaeota bacterium]
MTRKMFRILLFTLFTLLIAGWIGCQQKESEHAHQGESHQHSDATHANEHMHQVDFDTLVKHFEDPGREEWQKPDWVIEQLGDLQDKVVADIGAGTGYFSFRIAKKAQKVIAIDIDERFLNYIEEKNKTLQLPVETRLVEPDDP